MSGGYFQLIVRSVVFGAALAIAGAALAQPAAAPAPGRIVDPDNGCATSNPFPNPNETIRWTGGCVDGLLDGPGTLTWYRNGKVHERDEGTFRMGELHGEATITFADGSSIIGNYTDGKRNGEFIIVRADNTYIRAVYENDTLISERNLDRGQVRALIAEKRRTGHRPQGDVPPPQPAQQQAQAQPGAVAPGFNAWQQPGVVTAGAPAPQVAAQPIYYATPYYPASPTGQTVPTAAAAIAPWSPTAAGLAMGLPGAAQGLYYQTASYQPAAYQVASLAPVAPAPATTNSVYQAQIAYQQAYVAAQPSYMPPPAMQVAVVPAYVPAPAPPPAYAHSAAAVPALPSNADAGFVAAYALERAGQYEQAQAMYGRIAAEHAGTPSGMMAGDRMQQIAAFVPNRMQPQPQTQATPAAFQPPPASVARPAQPRDFTAKRVCSARGLYPNDARWCGVIRKQDGEEMLVQVSEVRTNGFFSIGIGASECTGGQFLGWFARGTEVWVPARCMR